MKVFITGANGLVGSYLSRLLLQHGYDIRASKRTGSRMDLLNGAEHQIDWFVGDILDQSYLKKVLKDADVVVHCAAIVSFAEDEQQKMNQINVKGTSNVVQACLDLKIPKLLFVSSIAAIGRNKSNHIITEKSEWKESPYNTAYAKSKYLAEQAVWEGHAQGLNVGIINPSVILGAGDWTSGSTKLFKTIKNGLKFYPMGATGVVDVRDVALALLLLISGNHNGQRFIINGHNISYLSLFTQMATALQVSPPRIKVGPILAPLSWRVSKLIATITGKAPTITKDTAMISSLNFEYPNKKSIQVLGMKYRPLEETINASAEALIHYQKDGIKSVLPF